MMRREISLIVVGENVVLVDATEKKSGQSRRVSIPLPIVKMVNREHAALHGGWNYEHDLDYAGLAGDVK